jgi:hypothetical protein
MLDRHPLSDALEVRLGDEPALLSAAALSVDRPSEAAAAGEIRLQGDIDFFTWMRLAATGRFAFDGLTADASSTAFDPGRPLRLELRLNPSGRRHPAAASGAAPDLAAAVLAAAPGTPLRSLENWDVVAVTQRLSPRVRAGFSVRAPET